AALGIPATRYRRRQTARSFGRFGKTRAGQLASRSNIPPIDLAALQRWNGPAANRLGLRKHRPWQRRGGVVEGRKRGGRGKGGGAEAAAGAGERGERHAK